MKAEEIREAIANYQRRWGKFDAYMQEFRDRDLAQRVGDMILRGFAEQLEEPESLPYSGYGPTDQ